jgi:hypothetical protein
MSRDRIIASVSVACFLAGTMCVFRSCGTSPGDHEITKPLPILAMIMLFVPLAAAWKYSARLNPYVGYAAIVFMSLEILVCVLLLNSTA